MERGGAGQPPWRPCRARPCSGGTAFSSSFTIASTAGSSGVRCRFGTVELRPHLRPQRRVRRRQRIVGGGAGAGSARECAGAAAAAAAGASSDIRPAPAAVRLALPTKPSFFSRSRTEVVASDLFDAPLPALPPNPSSSLGRPAAAAATAVAARIADARVLGDGFQRGGARRRRRPANAAAAAAAAAAAVAAVGGARQSVARDGPARRRAPRRGGGAPPAVARSSAGPG